jgi:hypothetical protein
MNPTNTAGGSWGAITDGERVEFGGRSCVKGYHSNQVLVDFFKTIS